MPVPAPLRASPVQWALTLANQVEQHVSAARLELTLQEELQSAQTVPWALTLQVVTHRHARLALVDRSPM